VLTVGDIAVMLRAGWSTLRVAIFQILSGATAFIGLYIGISISQQSEDAQQWIFILASSMFLYVALADVVCLTAALYTVYADYQQTGF